VALLYLDTSALVKLYVIEEGTEQMLAIAHPDANNQLAILALARVEFRAALRRRQQMGDIPAETSDDLIKMFQGHCNSVLQVQPINELVLEAAIGVVDRQTLRAYDALQLGGCLALRRALELEDDLQFVCADAKLVDAARDEGLITVNPATT
jgi:predicted nucleic acid-binding protein